MLPVLQIGPLAIQTYPLALLLAGWVALSVGAWVAGRLGLDGDDIYNAGLTGFAAGLVVGRLAHVITFWSAYQIEPSAIVGLNPRAFLPGPALAAALLTAGWYVYRRHLRLASVLDAAAAGTLAGLAVAGLGAFLVGRDLGIPAQVPWAVTAWGIKRHPVQIYEMLAIAAVLIAVLALLARPTRPGTMAWVALLGYGLVRWALEPLRADSATVLGGLRTAQVLGLAAALIALWALRSAMLTGSRRAISATEEASPPADG
jgi:prolipoprotein diacylglyceryltransferase